MIGIRRGNLDLIDQMSDLFNQYRIFYGQKDDLIKAKNFLLERINSKDSIIILGSYHNKFVGFMQPYPSFSSVRLQSIYVLNDLYVHSEYRNKGIASALINEAQSICKIEKNGGLQLETSKMNRANQLYKKLGFNLIDDTNFYSWSVQ